VGQKARARRSGADHPARAAARSILQSEGSEFPPWLPRENFFTQFEVVKLAIAVRTHRNSLHVNLTIGSTFRREG
jgi:hypothetical protein